MISFFILSVVLDRFTYEVEKDNKVIYLLYKAISLGFIFYGLYLIKNENTVYQYNILTKQKNLAEKNTEIEKQKEEISEKAMAKSIKPKSFKKKTERMTNKIKCNSMPGFIPFK